MSGENLSVAALAFTPVKSLRLASAGELWLGRTGARGDRTFFLIDERGRMINGKKLGMMHEVSARHDRDAGRLELRFPGEVVEGPVELGAQLETDFYSRPRAARAVLGPFSAALSAHARRPVRLVAPADGSTAVDRGPEGAVTMISSASVELLARVAELARVDPRRFRMNIELSGPGANEEDSWIGRELDIGEARIRVEGHVGRCIVTTMDPETGRVDLPTLDLLRSYRKGAPTTEPLALGVHCAVVREGAVRAGDRASLVEQRAPAA